MPAKLPLEVLYLVIDHAKADDTSINWTKTQRRALGRSLALTCRALRRVGSSLVWLEVVQQVATDVRLLRQVVEHPRVANVLSVLSLDARSYDGPRTEFSGCDDLLVHLTNLTTLSLRDFPPSLSKRLFARTSLPVEQTLRSFTYRDPKSCEPRTDLHHLFQTIARFENLTSLSLILHLRSRNDAANYHDAAIAEEAEDLVALASTFEQKSLETVRLFFREGLRSPPPVMVETILRIVLTKLVRVDALRVLAVTSIVDVSNDAAAWLLEFPHLEKLHLVLSFAALANLTPTLLRRLPSFGHLRVLQFVHAGHGPVVERTVTAPRRKLVEFLDALAPSLETLELSISFREGVTGGILGPFLLKRKLLPLRVVRCTVRDLETDERCAVWIRKERVDLGGTDGARWAINKERSVEVTYL